MFFGFLVTNVCNHGEHYEMPCVMFTGTFVSPGSDGI